MINGQDALLFVAHRIIKTGDNMISRKPLVESLVQGMNMNRAQAEFTVTLMLDKEYLKLHFIMMTQQDAIQHVSLTPKACARIREINAQRNKMQHAFEHEDAIARAEAMGDYERASRLTRELLEA